MTDADAFTAWEAAGWEERADAYHRIFIPLTTRIIGPLLDFATIGPGSRVLDVASGPGYVAAAAAARGAEATGVDIAAAMVDLAGRLHPTVRFVQVNVERLPFDDGSYDAVVGNFGILHFGRPEEAVSEFTRVLAPDGVLALSTWDKPEISSMPGIFFQAIQEAGAQPPADLPPGPPFYRFAEDEEFARLLRDVGLVDVKVETVTFTYHVPGVEQVWEWLVEATVRSRALVHSQPEAVKARIRDALARHAGRYADDAGGLDLPVSVKIAHGRRPDHSGTPSAASSARTPSRRYGS